MWLRLLAFLAVSILIHALFFSRSWINFEVPTHFHMNNFMSVNLIQGKSQDIILPAVTSSVPTQKNQTEREAGMSFVTEGTVSADYMEVLKKKIFDTWQYPDEAINKGQEGKVTVSFVLSSTGKMMEIGILKSSGSYILDSAAMAAVEKAAPFGNFSSQMKDKTIKITGNFCYVLD